jgi:CheY-like chemotaxis protein
LSAVNLAGRELLVVDDVRFSRLTLVKILAGMGCETVHQAEDGQAALKLLAEHGSRIACVISDLEMPQLDGLGLLQAIRAGTGEIPHALPFVILTGHSDFERLGPALLLDLDAFITKPVSKAALERCLGGLLGEEASAAARALAPVETYRRIDLSHAFAPAAAAAVATGAGDERRVALAALPEGAVLARDLMFSNGRLLIPAKTQLSARIVRRLNEIAAVSNLAAEAWIAD